MCRHDDGIKERDPGALRIWRQIRRERRRLAEARVREWTEYPFLVRCVEHPEWGAVTCEWAAEQLDEKPSRVAELANAGRVRLKGLRLHRDGYPFACPAPSHHKPVVCVETGREFPSIQAATDWLGAKSRATVAQGVAEGNAAMGFHFYRKGEAPPPMKGRKGGKLVVCVESGRPYPSMKAAADAIGCDPTSVVKAVRFGHSARGLHFRLAGRPAVPPPVPRLAPVRADGGRRVGSKTEAMKWALRRSGVRVPPRTSADYARHWMAFTRAVKAGGEFMGVAFSEAQPKIDRAGFAAERRRRNRRLAEAGRVSEVA